jgi:putative ABC transport system permease protein
MDALLHDLRYAVRTLMKAPAFTAIAIICLALGIAANVTVFTPVNTLLLRPLPFREPDRLMGVHMTQSARGRFEGSWSYADYRDVGTAGGAFESVGLVTQRAWNLGGVAEPERVNGASVTASLLPMLGLDPVLGRHLRPEDDDGGRVLLISDALWHRRFGGDPGAIGRAVTVNGEPYTIVGVMPVGIRFPEIADIWLPINPTQDAKTHRDWRSYEMLGRLRAGVTAQEAETKVAALAKQIADQNPGTNRGWTAWVQPYHEVFAKEVRPMMLILLGAVGFVLLIACANVANLLLARATSRQKEVAVRLALGASRRRIIQQLLTESLLLGLLGGAAGAALGSWGIEGIVRMLPAELPFWMVFDVDNRVLLMTLGVSLLTGVIFGLAPALQASSPALAETLKDTGRGATGTVRSGRLRNSLVVTEIALSLVLLIGAALMIQSFIRTQTATLGFEPRNLLTFELSLQGKQYATDTSRMLFSRALEARLTALPGVQGAGGVGQLPIRSCCSWTSYYPEGSTYDQANAPSALHNIATPGFFAAFKQSRLSGRVFDERDAIGAPKVVIVNRAFAERVWPRQNAVGQTLRLGDPTDSTRYTVVGVVGDVVQDNDDLARSLPQIYLPFAQSGWRTISVGVRTDGDPAAATAAVRAAIAELDKDLPLARVQSMSQTIREEMFESRVYGTMFGTFAIAALVLASIGLYGVMSYAVAQRTHEIGVRMALGAQPGDVLRLVVRSGIRLLAVGLLIGVPAAFGLAQVLRGALYGVTPSDPSTFVAIPAVLAIVALIASYVPARRATRVDPMVALRSD